MTEERWTQIQQKIRDSFEIAEEYKDDLEPGTCHAIEFESPAGYIKVSFIKRPKVKDKKTLYSNRIGGGVSVEYEYSEDETVCHMQFEKWDEVNEHWQKMDGDLF